jgi:Fe-S-cluster containining protein
VYTLSGWIIVLEMEQGAMENLASAVRAAAGRAEVREAVEGVYRDVAAAVAERRPACVMSGRCCRFEEYGHRLYVTTVELATFVHGMEDPRNKFRGLSGGALSANAESGGEWDGTGCPFQVSKLCGVHGIRPFGCRIYFCDATSTAWQQEAYEAFHGRLKRLHESLGVPYFYVEWRAALGAVLGVSSREPVEE